MLCTIGKLLVEMKTELIYDSEVWELDNRPNDPRPTRYEWAYRFQRKSLLI